MRAVPAAEFADYERSHQRLISIAVAPLFSLYGGLALLAAIAAPGLATLAVLASFAAILAVTALAAVPQHRALSSGFNSDAYRRLLRADTARLALALLGVAGALTHVIATAT